jgi:chromatin modification-related protein VID21
MECLFAVCKSIDRLTANQRKPSAVHETHAQYSKMPKHTPAELSRMKAEKEARDLQELQMARRRQQEELNRQTTHRMNVPVSSPLSSD